MINGVITVTDVLSFTTDDKLKKPVVLVHKDVNSKCHLMSSAIKIPFSEAVITYSVVGHNKISQLLFIYRVAQCNLGRVQNRVTLYIQLQMIYNRISKGFVAQCNQFY